MLVWISRHHRNGLSSEQSILTAVLQIASVAALNGSVMSFRHDFSRADIFFLRKVSGTAAEMPWACPREFLSNFWIVEILWN